MKIIFHLLTHTIFQPWCWGIICVSMLSLTGLQNRMGLSKENPFLDRVTFKPLSCDEWGVNQQARTAAKALLRSSRIQAIRGK